MLLLKSCYWVLLLSREQQRREPAQNGFEFLPFVWTPHPLISGGYSFNVRFWTCILDKAFFINQIKWSVLILITKEPQNITLPVILGCYLSLRSPSQCNDPTNNWICILGETDVSWSRSPRFPGSVSPETCDGHYPDVGFPVRHHMCRMSHIFRVSHKSHVPHETSMCPREPRNSVSNARRRILVFVVMPEQRSRCSRTWHGRGRQETAAASPFQHIWDAHRARSEKCTFGIWELQFSQAENYGLKNDRNTQGAADASVARAQPTGNSRHIPITPPPPPLSPGK